MHPFVRTTLLAIITSQISACGGGGDGGNTPPNAPSNLNSETAANVADKYVGTWTNTCRADNGTFVNSIATVTKGSDQQYRTQAGIYRYNSGDCSGTGTLTTTDSGDSVMTLDGTMTVDNKVVDKITYTDNAHVTRKSVAVVTGNTLVVGDDQGPLDANGYPLTLITNNPYTRR